MARPAQRQHAEARLQRRTRRRAAAEVQERRILGLGWSGQPEGRRRNHEHPSLTMLGTGVRELGRRSLRLLASLEARPAAPCSTLEPPVTLAVARGFACRSCTAPTLTGAFRGVTRGWAAAAGLLACRGFRAAAAARDVRAASGGDAGEGASPTPAWLPDGAVPSPLPKERSLLEEVQGMSRKRQQCVPCLLPALRVTPRVSDVPRAVACAAQQLLLTQRPCWLASCAHTGFT